MGTLSGLLRGRGDDLTDVDNITWLLCGAWFIGDTSVNLETG